MSEPSTIYSTRRAPFTAAEIGEFAADGKVQVDGSNDAWRKITIQWPGCTMTIHGEQRDDLPVQLDGMRGYLWRCSQEKMTQALYALIQRTYFFRNVYGTVSEPALNESATQFLKRLASAGAGVIFRGDCFYNPGFELLVGPGRVAEANRPAYWPDALERRDRSFTTLQTRGLEVPESLPPIPGEAEVVLRTPQETARRALALYAVAYRAVPNGIGRGEAWSWLQGEESCLSPNERKFLKAFFPGKDDKIQFGWRFESLATLLWALGLCEISAPPSQPIEVSAIDAVIKRVTKKSLIESPALRPTAEILDHLDLIYRYHWLTTDARVKGDPAPNGIDPGVVLERHYALNWLTSHQDAPWDEVSTDT